MKDNGKEVQDLREAVDGLRSQIHASLEAQAALEQANQLLQGRVSDLEFRVASQLEDFAGLKLDFERAVKGAGALEAAEGAEESDEQRAARVGLAARVAEIEGLVRGRNRSAPVKRNMTDDDAVRVLMGDVADLGHKEAGEVVGLTYAQVYSCRLEYTFKHVHKRLKAEGFKNEWTK